MSTIPFVFVVFNRFILFWIDGFGLVAGTDRSLGAATNTTRSSYCPHILAPTVVHFQLKKKVNAFKNKKNTMIPGCCLSGRLHASNASFPHEIDELMKPSSSERVRFRLHRRVARKNPNAASGDTL